MKSKKLATGLLIMLLMLGVVGASASDASSAQGSGTPELPQELPVWQQVNSNGFGNGVGDTGPVEVSALGVFNGYLYAGTNNPIEAGLLFDGARIFRSQNGITWVPDSPPGFGVAHDTAPTAILDMVVFGNYIYASTGRSGNEAKIYRTLVANGWAPVVDNGFSEPNNHDITALAVYNNQIFAGVTNTEDGARIYRSYSGDSGSWGQVAPTDPGTVKASVTGFAKYDGGLYAAIESEAPAQIWSSYGADWTAIMTDGFGDTNTILTGGMAAFGSYLFVGAGNTVDGAQLWRFDGVNWDPVIIQGLGDAGNEKVEAVFVFQKQLYISVKNATTGMKLWRSGDGTSWERANPDGFGNSHNTGTNFSNASADFLCNLFMGTSNATDDGELWATQQRCVFIPLSIR